MSVTDPAFLKGGTKKKFCEWTISLHRRCDNAWPKCKHGESGGTLARLLDSFILLLYTLVSNIMLQGAARGTPNGKFLQFKINTKWCTLETFNSIFHTQLKQANFNCA